MFRIFTLSREVIKCSASILYRQYTRFPLLLLLTLASSICSHVPPPDVGTLVLVCILKKTIDGKLIGICYDLGIPFFTKCYLYRNSHVKGVRWETLKNRVFVMSFSAFLSEFLCMEQMMSEKKILGILMKKNLNREIARFLSSLNIARLINAPSRTPKQPSTLFSKATCSKKNWKNFIYTLKFLRYDKEINFAFTLYFEKSKLLSCMGPF